MREFRSLTVALLLLSSAFTLCVSAQSPVQPPIVATKVDEYGAIRGCDHSARLDNLAIQIQSLPRSKAFVAAYAAEASAALMLHSIHSYLVNTRGISSDQIEIAYAGRNDVLSQPRVQLWVVPSGATKPRLQKFKPNIESFQGLFSENQAYDTGDFEGAVPGLEIDEDTGPSLANAFFTHVSLVDVLKHQKTAVVYIVSYNGEDAAPRAWRRVADKEVANLKSFGIEANRLKTIFGGTARETKVQLWVAPADAVPPVTDAGEESPSKRSVQLFSFADYELSDEKLERSAFKRVADALRQFPTLQAYVIVRFGTYVEPPDEPESETVSSGEQPQEIPGEDNSPELEVIAEPETADVAALAEKWRTELTDTLKISASRLVILFTQSDDYSTNNIETWVVPPGGSLPNPNAEEEEAFEIKLAQPAIYLRGMLELE